MGMSKVRVSHRVVPDGEAESSRVPAIPIPRGLLSPWAWLEMYPVPHSSVVRTSLSTYLRVFFRPSPVLSRPAGDGPIERVESGERGYVR